MKIRKNKEINCDSNKEIKQKSRLKLFFVLDRKYPDIEIFAKRHNINLSKVYYDIDSIRDDIILNGESCRIVIVETGHGELINTGNLDSIMDMIGICDDDVKVTIFYTDKELKSEGIKRFGKGKEELEWVSFKNMISVFAYLLFKNEVYVGSKVEVKENEGLLEYVGEKIEAEREEIIFNIEDLIENRKKKEHGRIERYEPNI